MHLNAWLLGSGTNGEGFLGGVTLLDVVCHWGVGSEVSKAQAKFRVTFFLLPEDRDEELLATSQAP